MSAHNINYATYTAHLSVKPFVRESEGVVQKPSKKEKQRLNFEGHNAQSAYLEIIRQEYDKETKVIQTKGRIVKSDNSNIVNQLINKTATVHIKKPESSNESISKISINAILKAVEQKDLHFLEKHVTLQNVNLTDEFGWTPLMSAAYCGYVDIVEFLLSVGANRKAKDRSGYTAAQLALKRNHLKIVALIKRKSEFLTEKSVVESQSEVPQNKGQDSCTKGPINKSSKCMHEALDKKDKSGQNYGFYCDVCDATFYQATRKSHETSTLHIFNMKPKLSHAFYGIPRQSKGYQMLLNTGWDEQRGLGPFGNGIKYPVKTYLKTDRKGLGQPFDKEPRVTHFKAGDTKAISNTNQPKPKCLKRRDREKLLSKEARKEREIRIALS